jgi:hypothetical protein
MKKKEKRKKKAAKQQHKSIEITVHAISRKLTFLEFFRSKTSIL